MAQPCRATKDRGVQLDSCWRPRMTADHQPMVRELDLAAVPRAETSRPEEKECPSPRQITARKPGVLAQLGQISQRR